MVGNYDFANATAIVQHWSRAHAEDRGQRPQLQRAFAPGAEDEAADREAEQRPAHVNQDEWPRVRFKGGEHRNGRVFHEQEREPTGERDFETAECACRVQSRDQHRQCVVDDNRSDKRKDVGADIMCALDVGHRPGVQIKPLLAEDSVPSPADEEINHD